MTVGPTGSRVESLKEHILTSPKLSELDKHDLKYTLDELVSEAKREVLALPKRLGNPAVVGLAGFGVSSMLLQFHNLGWMDYTPPILWCGLWFGGLAQLIAGLMEFGTGNNFGFCAFSSYGAFWLAFGSLKLGGQFMHSTVVTIVHNETTSVVREGTKAHIFDHVTQEKAVGLFLVAFTIYTLIMLIGSARENTALFVVFLLLFIGLVFLVFAHFYDHVIWIKRTGGAILLIDAFGALYILAHIIYLDTYKYDVLPVGPPLHQWSIFSRGSHAIPQNNV